MQNSNDKIIHDDPAHAVSSQSLPDDSGQLEIMDFVRIFDPSTNETIVEQRS